jgi:hypothetical protein
VSIVFDEVSQPSLFVEDKTDATPVKRRKQQKRAVKYFNSDKKAFLELIQITFSGDDPN